MTIIPPLAHLGFKALEPDHTIPAERIARVFTAHRDRFAAHGLCGEITLYLPGKLQFAEQSLTVGDFCLIGPTFEDESGKTAAIVDGVLPRSTVIERAIGGRMQLIAANVDVAFIVTSANDDFNVNRLQRYLLLAEASGIAAIIVLSKVDLAAAADELLATLRQQFAGTEIIATRSDEDASLDPIRERLAAGHKTGIFLGSSGVGKSTLVNGLMAADVQATSGIREDDSRGRHTTSHRELFQLADGGLIIDSPGLRELSVAAATDDLEQTFSELAALMAQCQFRDCQHQGEPGCAVQQAIASGELSERELGNFRKLEREATYHQLRADKGKMANAKKRWKKVSVTLRKRNKVKF